MEKTNIGARLREERENAGLSQAQLANITGASTRTHIAWEKGEQTPNAVYLAAMSAKNIDVSYVITGIRSVTQESIEAELEQLSTAWEAIAQALQEANKKLPAGKMRTAAESLYKAVKEGSGEPKPLAKMLMEAA